MPFFQLPFFSFLRADTCRQYTVGKQIIPSYQITRRWPCFQRSWANKWPRDKIVALSTCNCKWGFAFWQGRPNNRSKRSLHSGQKERKIGRSREKKDLAAKDRLLPSSYRLQSPYQIQQQRQGSSAQVHRYNNNPQQHLKADAENSHIKQGRQCEM